MHKENAAAPWIARRITAKQVILENSADKRKLVVSLRFRTAMEAQAVTGAHAPAAASAAKP